MTWASHHIIKLLAGETVSFRPHGNSMKGKINSGQLCTVAPCLPEDIEVGDVVLCKVKGRVFLHLVKAMRQEGHYRHFLIGNNKGHDNGWTHLIYGKLMEVSD